MQILTWSHEVVMGGPGIRKGAVAVVFLLASLSLASGGTAQQSARTGTDRPNIVRPNIDRPSVDRPNIERLIRQNHLDEAEQQLWVTLRAHPDEVWALDLLGTVRLKQKRNSEAQALFQRAYGLNQGDVPALRGLGEEARSASRFDDAIGWYAKLLAIAPEDIPARKVLSILQEKTGKYQESIATIKALPVAARTTPDLLPVLASDYLALHQEEKMKPLVAQVLRLGPAKLGITLDFVAVLIRNGYIEDADKILQVVRPARPSADYLHILGRVREAQGQISDASALLQQALQLEPKSFDLLFDCARFAALHQRWEETVDLLQRANLVNPDRPDVLLKLTLALLKTRRRDRAVAVAKTLYGASPNDPDAQYIFAFALVENEQLEMAEPIALKAVQSRPEDANFQLLMGIVQLSRGELEAARQSLDRSLAIDPNLQEAHYYSALISERSGNIDAALKELQPLVEKAPDHAGWQAELGVLELRTGNIEGARSALETAVRLQPEAPQSHYQLGLVYSRIGLQDESQAEMAQFKKLRDAEDALRRHEAGIRTP